MIQGMHESRSEQRTYICTLFLVLRGEIVERINTRGAKIIGESQRWAEACCRSFDSRSCENLDT